MIQADAREPVRSSIAAAEVRYSPAADLPRIAPSAPTVSPVDSTGAPEKFRSSSPSWLR